MATLSTLKTNAELVRNATTVGENTAERVGGVLVGIVEYLTDNTLTEFTAAEVESIIGSVSVG